MPNYEDDLREERQLNELLRAKLNQSDARLERLEALSQEVRDPFREILLRELGVDQRKLAVPNADAMARKPIDRLQGKPEGLMKVVRFIGRRDVSLSELTPFIVSSDFASGKDPRRVMFDYKKYGLLENFRKGFYRLNQEGLKSLEELEGASNLA